jgi:hypothetical protein
MTLEHCYTPRKATNLAGNNGFVGVARFHVHSLFRASDGNKFTMYSKLDKDELKRAQIVRRICARHPELIITRKVTRHGC